MTHHQALAGRRAALSSALRDGPIIAAPGVFDLLSAKIADGLGFRALYMTGYGVNASLLGKPDAGLGTFAHFVDRVRAISDVCATPLIADADTGFGGALNVAETVRGYERAGAAAIQLEDQVFPKRCGHTLGRAVVPAAEMALKIRVAKDTREDRQFLIIARTDARTAHGLDEALRRADEYLQAGADVLFVESPESADELAAIGARFRGVPLLANLVPGGRTPLLPAAELESLGFRIAIHPLAGLSAAAAALTQAYRKLHTGGDAPEGATFNELNAIAGFPAVWDFDRRYGG